MFFAPPNLNIWLRAWSVMNRSVLNGHRPNNPRLNSNKANVIQLCTQSIYSWPSKNDSRPYDVATPDWKTLKWSRCRRLAMYFRCMYCDYFRIGPDIHNRVNGNAAINARCERLLKMLRSTALDHRSKMLCIVFFWWFDVDTNKRLASGMQQPLFCNRCETHIVYCIIPL